MSKNTSTLETPRVPSVRTWSWKAACEPFDVWELSAFLDAHDAPVPRTNAGRVVAYHDSCHMLRELGVSEPPRRLLERSGAVVRPLARPDLCCGFGGTFSVKMPDVSVAMADEKIKALDRSGADVLISGDSSCLMHLEGRLRRTGHDTGVYHLAQILDPENGRTG